MSPPEQIENTEKKQRICEWYVPDTNYRMVFLGPNETSYEQFLGYIPHYSPVTKLVTLWHPMRWIALLLDESKRTLVGYYKGTIGTDSKGRRFSYSSYINIIRPYQGKGLCTPFAGFSYECLNEFHDVSYICVTVGSNNNVNACKCYSAAARIAGYIPYFKTAEVGVDRSECQLLSDENSSVKMLFVRKGETKDSIMEAECKFSH